MIDTKSGKSTKKLIDEFFEVKGNENTTKSYRSKIYRDEVWQYEVELSKPLTEMDTEEIVTLINSFKNKLGKKPNPAGYNAICYIFREFFSWYRYAYNKTMNNPMDDRRFISRSEITRTFGAKTLQMDEFEENISDMREDSADEKSADYTEMIYRMALEGFANTVQILSIKEDMIDFEKCIINLDETSSKHVSTGLMNLMIKCHEYEEFLYKNKRKQSLLSFKDSYVKIPTKNVGNDIKEEALKLNRYLYNNGIKDMSYTDCYRLGLIEYLKQTVSMGDLRMFVELDPNDKEYRLAKIKVESEMSKYGVEISSTWAKSLLCSYIH